jgi:hypothetical protein
MGSLVKAIKSVLVLIYCILAFIVIGLGYSANVGTSDWLSLLVLLVLTGSLFFSAWEALSRALNKPILAVEPEVFQDGHPCHEIVMLTEEKASGNVIFLTLRVENRGYVTADDCSGAVTFQGRLERRDSLNWMYWGFRTDQFSIDLSEFPMEILGKYATNRVVRIRRNHSENLDVLFTVKNHNIAYSTTARRVEFQIPGEYEMELRLVGANFEDKIRRFRIKLESWDKIGMEEILDP